MKILKRLFIIITTLIITLTLVSCGDDMGVDEAYTIFTQKVVTDGSKFLGDKYAITKTHTYFEVSDVDGDGNSDILYEYYEEETWVTKYGYHYKQSLTIYDVETETVIEEKRTVKESLTYLYEGYANDDANNDGIDDGIYPDLGYYEFYDPEGYGAWSSKNSNGIRWTLKLYTVDEIAEMRGENSDMSNIVKNIYDPLNWHTEAIGLMNVIQGETRTSEFAMIYTLEPNVVNKLTCSTVDVMSDIFKGKYYPKKLVIDNKNTGLIDTYTWSAGVWKITDAVIDRFGNVYDNARSVGWVIVE